MYSPKYAIQDNPQENERIIREYPFATVVYVQDDIPQSFHLPMVLENQTLIGHMALANPAWKALTGLTALFIFHGPHHYVSPTFYGTENNVPTWNYVSVQVRGEVKIRQDEAFLKRALLLLSRQHDPAFRIEENIAQNDKLLGSIVGLEIEIKEIFGKFKLAQSKPEAERLNVIDALEKTDEGKRTAEEMRRTLKSDR